MISDFIPSKKKNSKKMENKWDDQQFQDKNQPNQKIQTEQIQQIVDNEEFPSFGASSSSSKKQIKELIPPQNKQVEKQPKVVEMKPVVKSFQEIQQEQFLEEQMRKNKMNEKPSPQINQQILPEKQLTSKNSGLVTKQKLQLRFQDLIPKPPTDVQLTQEVNIQKQGKNKQIVTEEFTQTQQKELKFENIEIGYLFKLLLNDKRTQMQKMKNYFEDENDYQQHILPLFINENLAQIKQVSEEFMNSWKFNQQNSYLPLRYKISIDQKKTVLGKGFEGDYDQYENVMAWKRHNVYEYLDFLQSKLYIVQLIIKTAIKGESISLLGILEKEDNNKGHTIFLPWSKRVINTFKIPYIFVESSEFISRDPVKMLKNARNTYQERDYPNFDELFLGEFLVHINPVLKPTTYLIEIKSLKKINLSPFFNCIIQPQNYKTPKSIYKKALEFSENILQIGKKFYQNPEIKALFNASQWTAIKEAVNFEKPVKFIIILNKFTLINGPPGTGKTFTSLGIMSIFLEHMRESNQKGVILACGHSNTVINDWVRKCLKAVKLAKEEKKGTIRIREVPSNTLIDSQGMPYGAKVLRIGNPDKCDPDIFDYCLEIKAQRSFFFSSLGEHDKKVIDEFFPDELVKANCYTIIHVKKRIQIISNQINDLNEKIEFLNYNYIQGAVIYSEIEKLQWKKKSLKEIFQLMQNKLDEKMRDYQTVLASYLQGVQIIVSTLTSSQTQRLKDFLEENELPIVACIVDEAPMCFEPSILIPLANQDIYKLILIGDPKQLGPVVFDTTNSENLIQSYTRSLYERMLDNGIQEIMLNIQYRSMPNISLMTSKFFYCGKVIDDLSVKSKQLPKYLQGLLNPEKNFLFFDAFYGQENQSSKKSYFNYLEAIAVAYLVKFLVQQLSGTKEQVISVITPYKAQVKEIKKQLLQETNDPNIFDYVEVNTVDSFQVFVINYRFEGKENDIMIISLVRSEGIGFLRDIRRANVATSRAQYGQFIFGNSNVFMNQPFWKEIYSYISSRNWVVEYVEEQLKIKCDFYKLLFKNK